MSMKLVPTNEKVNIKWFVYAGEEKIRYNKTMRGQWGYEASCSCWWETRSGGAVRSSIQWEIETHKVYDHGYKWYNSNDEIGYEEFAQKEAN